MSSAYQFAILIGFVAILAWTSGYKYRVALFGFAFIVAILLWVFSLGTPRPSWPFGIKDGQLVSVVLDEPHAIYVEVLPDGARSPTLYSLPWSKDQAKQIQETQGEANKHMMTPRFGAKCDAGHCGVSAYLEQNHPLPPKTKSNDNNV